MRKSRLFELQTNRIRPFLRIHPRGTQEIRITRARSGGNPEQHQDAVHEEAKRSDVDKRPLWKGQNLNGFRQNLESHSNRLVELGRDARAVSL